MFRCLCLHIVIFKSESQFYALEEKSNLFHCSLSLFQVNSNANNFGTINFISLFILTAQLYILSDFLIGADDCFCEANNNTYSPVSSDNCETFVQQPNNGKHNCPMGLRFDTRMCVCNHAAIVHCPATCGPQG